MGALACASGCSRQGGGAETRIFLQQVVHVRAQLGSDADGRIPAMIRGQDSAMLTDEILTLGKYRLALANLGSGGVDPKAIQLRQAVLDLVEAYRSVCLDTAEFFREVNESDERQPGRAPIGQTIRYALEPSQGDTLATLDRLIETTGGLDMSPNGHAVFLAPIANTIRMDRMRLKGASDAQSALASQVAVGTAD
jgi:hypothetical protein